MAMFEEDEDVGPIGPRIVTMCRTADIYPLSVVEFIVYNGSW
jgi:hypothetical protein